ncbi:MAG: hypothetical protein ACRD22_07985 [Terriglobia bacterium]
MTQPTSSPWQLIGKTIPYCLPHSDITIPVKIIDVRTNYGRVDVRIQPVHGCGSQWVQWVEVKL